MNGVRWPDVVACFDVLSYPELPPFLSHFEVDVGFVHVLCQQLCPVSDVVLQIVAFGGKCRAMRTGVGAEGGKALIGAETPVSTTLPRSMFRDLSIRCRAEHEEFLPALGLNDELWFLTVWHVVNLAQCLRHLLLNKMVGLTQKKYLKRMNLSPGHKTRFVSFLAALKTTLKTEDRYSGGCRILKRHI